jgi:P pilus assembly chaperone PapD
MLPVLALFLFAQTAGLGINPGRAEIEMKAGQEKTISFEIEAPPSDIPMRGRLTLALADWLIDEEAGVTYVDAGTLPDSAAAWIVFSPAAVNISSGQKQTVRVTVRVAANTPPGDYRTAIFIQERPPAAPPGRDEHLVYVRFRYVFFLYVVVPPVSSKPELVDVALRNESQSTELVCVLKNAGSRHARPYITWSIRGEDQQLIGSMKQYEATVLLPFSSITERFPIENLLPGKYEITAQADFQDNGPLQSITRTVELPSIN